MTEQAIVVKDIHHAINEVYKRIGYVAKKGKVDMGNNRSYKFAGEAEFIAAIRPEMAELGIYQQPLHVEIVTNERIESEKEWNGKITKSYQHRAVIKTVYRFIHKDSATWVEVTAIGEGMDTGDKAFNKAMTGANKYAVRQLFMIETGDDPDKYASDENGGIVPAPREAKSVFKNAATRKTYCENIIQTIEGSETVDDLNEAISLYKPKFEEMRTSGNEYDEIAVDEMKNRYKIKLAALKKAEEDAKSLAASYPAEFLKGD